jgi:aspartate racemase
MGKNTGAPPFCLLNKTPIQPYNQMMEADEMQTRGRMIGILGGMGPEATLDLYRHIIKLTPAVKDQDHIRILIYSNPKIPDRTEAIAGNGESPLAELIRSAKLLEKSGVGIIAMPCNASHYFLSQIQREVGIPILDMIAETCRALHETLPQAKRVGLIAALGTVHSGVYHKALERLGINTLVPARADQQRIQAAIGQVKAGAQNRSTQEIFQSIGMRLVEAGASAVILGCTEVPLAFEPDEVTYPSMNSTRILAKAAVAWALRA